MFTNLCGDLVFAVATIERKWCKNCNLLYISTNIQLFDKHPVATCGKWRQGWPTLLEQNTGFKNCLFKNKQSWKFATFFPLGAHPPPSSGTFPVNSLTDSLANPPFCSRCQFQQSNFTVPKSYTILHMKITFSIKKKWSSFSVHIKICF